MAIYFQNKKTFPWQHETIDLTVKFHKYSPNTLDSDFYFKDIFLHFFLPELVIIAIMLNFLQSQRVRY